jgi:hypothetical protein
MGDHISEVLQQLRNRNRNREIEEEFFLSDDVLGGYHLILDEHSIPIILNRIDCFVSKCERSDRVTQVSLDPVSLFGQGLEFWDKVGQAIGNLQALKKICIGNRNCRYHVEDEDFNLPIPDWEILARLLTFVRQRITLAVCPHVSAWRAEDIRSFARAIHGHPTITSFGGGEDNFPEEDMDTLYAALATLPALESLILSNGGLHTLPEDESALANPESLTELLRVPSLRFVYFSRFYFTRALCQATANALMDGTVITKLEFRACSFSAEECATILANGFSRNTSVSHMRVVSPLDRGLYSSLATALSSNSTLQDLFISVAKIDDNPDLSPVLLALGNNTGLKSLKVAVHGSIGESMCTAMQNGLGMNETLESLELNDVRLCDDNADLWCRALSFLRTNKALKSLSVDVDHGVMESCLFAFRIDIVAMLQENTSLESLFIRKSFGTYTKAEEYVALVTSLQQNTTLKMLQLNYGKLQLTDDEDKHLANILKKNFALDSLPKMKRAGDVGTILRLNAAGRRYLIEDGSSISKGVIVLSAVRSDINCVFLHLLENPRLCDRRAVEVASNSIEERSGSANPANHNGKREQGQALEEGKESRRRRT